MSESTDFAVVLEVKAERFPVQHKKIPPKGIFLLWVYNRRKETEARMETETIDIVEHHERELKRLPLWIVTKGVGVLRDTITLNSGKYLREAYKESPSHWWVESHFFWGMTMRNLLREKVCLDDELPSKNWDDYYVSLIEIAVGVREMP